MEKILTEAKGVNGQLVLLEGKLRIARKGAMSFLTQGMKGDKDILISHISSIQFKKAGLMTNGYIQVSFLGGRETKAGIFNATQDENTVMFTPRQQSKFLQIKAKLEEMMVTPPVKGASNLDELEKLANLKEKGVITEDEFNQKKKQLLGL